ncbi:hypothetical protein H6P81_001858 [Aristolochia fimbriata]|uniref:Uncharacterized protein n=1 Tax=Aristolochia fimbriata TaxID=158543 RepID=A0AAV7F823_ARIFI|nr:hypothetical protein H6P81_001858 [Aristolochia fimbriata]
MQKRREAIGVAHGLGAWRWVESSRRFVSLPNYVTWVAGQRELETRKSSPPPHPVPVLTSPRRPVKRLTGDEHAFIAGFLEKVILPPVQSRIWFGEWPPAKLPTFISSLMKFISIPKTLSSSGMVPPATEGPAI